MCTPVGVECREVNFEIGTVFEKSKIEPVQFNPSLKMLLKPSLHSTLQLGVQ